MLTKRIKPENLVIYRSRSFKISETISRWRAYIFSFYVLNRQKISLFKQIYVCEKKWLRFYRTNLVKCLKSKTSHRVDDTTTKFDRNTCMVFVNVSDGQNQLFLHQYAKTGTTSKMH